MVTVCWYLLWKNTSKEEGGRREGAEGERGEGEEGEGGEVL